MHKYLLILIAFTLSICTSYATPKEEIVPDSMISEDGVYYYLFSAPKKSIFIMQQLREHQHDYTGKKLSTLDLDFLEGDMHYNTSHYIMSIHYYRKALAQAEKDNDSENTFALMHRLVSSYDATYNEESKTQVLYDMQQKAKKENNLPMQSIALFELGNSLCMQRNFADGLPKMEKAIKMMETCKYKHKYDNLRYQYMQIVVQYRKSNKIQEALAMCNKMRTIIGKLDEGISPMEHEKEAQECTLLSQLSSLYIAMGDKAKADETYERYKKLQEFVPGHTNIFNYLIDAKRFDEVIPMAMAAEKKYKDQGDTISYNFASILKALATAQLHNGDSKNAANNFRRLAIIRDSINSREMGSQAAEFNAIYNVRQLEQETKRSRLVGITSSVIAIVSLLALIMFVIGHMRIRRYHKMVRLKNIALARTIEQLSKAQEDTQLSFKRQQKTQGSDENEKKCNCPNDEDQKDCERRMFMRLEHEIISRRLYAANLNRDQLIKELGIPRTQFASLFRDYAGESYTKYMNRLRLREAVRLMREKPNLTIDAIVANCGMSRQLFYMLFREEYGITPTEFRAAQGQKE